MPSEKPFRISRQVVKPRACDKYGMSGMCIRKIGKVQEVNARGHFDEGVKDQTEYMRNGMAMVIKLT